MSFSWLLVLSALASLLPMLMTLCSSYLKISILIGLLRSGLSTQQVPSGMVVFGFSFALSLFIMGPVLDDSLREAQKIDPKMFSQTPEMAHLQILEPVVQPWRRFLRAHVGERELGLLKTLREERATLKGEDSDPHPQEAREPDLPLLALAYLATEMRQAFLMGAILLLPFLVIDLFVSNILMGMGLSMVSPMSVSLPLKLLLFVWADGWMVLCRSLVKSYAIG